MRLTLIFAVLLVAGCVGRTSFPPISEQQADASGSAASRVSELSVGMTLADASLIVGSAVGSYDDPTQVGHVCFSHPYGAASGQQFVHTEFLGGHLVSASDGHSDMCGPGDI